MTRRFCDLCGNEALADYRADLHQKHGDPYGGTLCELPKQCLIVVRCTFGFESHQTGFGGPPDLCKPCAAQLVRELAERMEMRALAERLEAKP